MNTQIFPLWMWLIILCVAIGIIITLRARSHWQRLDRIRRYERRRRKNIAHHKAWQWVYRKKPLRLPDRRGDDAPGD